MQTAQPRRRRYISNPGPGYHPRSAAPGANVVSWAVISRLRLQDNVLLRHKSFYAVSLSDVAWVGSAIAGE